MSKLKKIGIERDLLIVDVLTLILVLVVSISDSTWLRIIFGLPFILFFPGYTLIAALFPRKERLSGIERLALSLGLSIAIVPLIGLVLNYTWSIDLYPILISLSLFIMAMSTLGWYKRRRYSAGDRFSVPFLYRQNLPGLKWGKAEGLDKVISIFLVAAILGTIATIAYAVITTKEEDKFTEFYILGIGSNAEEYPEELVVGEMEELILGIVNQEQETTSYKVEIWLGGDQVNVQLGEAEMDEIETGSLAHEAKWEQQVGFAALDPSISTAMSAPATKGQNRFAVTVIDGFEIDDYVQIGSGDEELVQIKDIDVVNSEIIINTELKYDHVEGDPVTEKQRVEFRLFNNEDSEPYLSLHLYVDVRPV